MAKHVIHLSEEEAATTNLALLLAQVRAGAEVVIENNQKPVAIVRSVDPYVRLLSESLRLAKERRSTATLDSEFERDMNDVLNGGRDTLNPPTWD